MNNKPGPYRSDALDVGQAGDVVRCERWRAEWYGTASRQTMGGYMSHYVYVTLRYAPRAQITRNATALARVV